MSKAGSALIGGGLVVAAGLLFMTVPAIAHFVPNPECDFITGGGFVFEDGGGRDNFGAHGGCKKNGPDAPFWGHVNYVDHNGFNGVVPYHVNSTEITGYVFDPAFPNARDVCGIARTNDPNEPTVNFRVRMEDNGEGSNATAKDRFGIRLSNGYLVTPRNLGDDEPGGGNIQLHEPNPSTPAPCSSEADCRERFPEFVICAGLSTPEEG